MTFTEGQKAEFAAGLDQILADAPDYPEPSTFTGEVHPYAERWPMRPADEIDDMASSIASNGQRFPIILTPDGVLVDGRNRLAACDLANVAPVFEVRDDLTDEDAITSFIWDANGDRRNLSKGQRAMLAALMPGRGDLLSKSVQVSGGFVAKARQVIQWCDSEVVEQVIAGDLALNDAYAAAQQIKATEQAEEIARRKAEKEAAEQARRDAARLADLREHRADLAGLVDEGRIQLAEALKLRADDAAKEERRAAAEAAAIRQRVYDFRAALASISDAKHPKNRAVLLTNWTPGAHDWTAAELHDLADLLHAIADEWTRP